MAEEKKLYPFRLEAFEDVYGWGVEKFALADLGYRDTPYATAGCRETAWAT